MSFDDERAAIEKRMSDNWSTTPVKYENVSFSRPSTAWVALYINTGLTRQITLGDQEQVHRNVGIITVQICIPEDTGTAAARMLADAVGTLFRNATFSYSDSGRITCYSPSLRSGGTQDGWFTLYVDIPYKRDALL